MKIPLSPPPIEKLLVGLSPERLSAVLQGAAQLGEKYFHWDELRHRQPPADYSVQEWWLRLKLPRMALFRPLDFFDKYAKPFRFAMPNAVLKALHEIDQQAAGRIDAELPIVSPADRDRYLISSLIEESVTSSQLEGASTTRAIAKNMLRSGRKPQDRSEQMIFNNFQAMQAIAELRGQPFTPQRILSLHQLLTQETLDDTSAAGRLRRDDEKVDVVDYRDAVILHAPPPADELPNRLQRLCNFANANGPEPAFVHPVIRAIVLHFMLAYDHPFVDGNGRTARALFYWSMANAGYWLMEYISISSLIRKAPGQYARAFLHTETDENDLTYFVIHQLDVIQRAIQHLYRYLQRKTTEEQTAAHWLQQFAQVSGALNHRQVALLGHALRHSGYLYTVASHQRSHHVTQQTARTDLQALVNLGLLHQRKHGRAFVFSAAEQLHDKLTAMQQ
jgi:Fic family protein